MVAIPALQALCALRSHGSVVAAAAALGYTPSGVSQQLARLQGETGTVLMERHGRGLRLTESGQILADAAQRILAEWDRANAVLEQLREEVVGTVRMAAFPTAVRGLMPQALASLAKTAPALEVSLVEVDSHQTVQMVARGDADFAIAHDWADTPMNLPDQLSGAILGQDIADVVVGASHPLAKSTTVSLADLGDEKWIAERGSVAHDLLLHFMSGDPGNLKILHFVREFPTQLALIAAGQGIGLVPRLGRGALSDEVAAVPTDPASTRRIYGIARAENVGRPAIQAISLTLKELFIPAVGAGARDGRVRLL